MGFTFSRAGRALALLVALTAFAGVAVQFQASSAHDGPPLATLWGMARYFTNLTNSALAVIFAGVALGRPGFARPSLLGGATLAILLVGAVYSLLLAGLHPLSDIERLSNFLMHYASPALTSWFWLAFAPKGGLRRRDPLLWAAFPLIYLAYVLARGGIDGRYPYGFLDVGKIGWNQTGVNVAAISAGFLMAGAILLWLDRWLGRRDRRTAPTA